MKIKSIFSLIAALLFLTVARADVGIIDSPTIVWTRVPGVSGKADVVRQFSITADASGLKLSGDASAPGNWYFYGTNGSGTKGFQLFSMDSIVDGSTNRLFTATEKTKLAAITGTHTGNNTGDQDLSAYFSTATKTDVLQAGQFATDAGSTDTYVATLSPAITAYVTGVKYLFKANTANTGAASINFNGLGAKTIVKVAGGITTTLANNDIRAGQWVEVAYDGTNMQMLSAAGNAASGSGDALVANPLTQFSGVSASNAEVNHLVGVTSPIQTQLGLKANAANAALTGSTAYDKLTPNLDALGTITGGSTATLLGTKQVHTATFSGTTATIALPASPTDGVHTLHGTSTSGSQLVITTPSLIRPEYDLDTPTTTLTIPATSTGQFTAQFTALGGSFVKMSCVGDALAPIVAATGVTSTATGDVSATTVQAAIAELASEKQTAAQVAAAVNARNVTFVLTIDALADSMNYTIGYVPAAFTITELRFVHNGTLTSPSIVPTIKHGTNRASGTAVVTSPSAVTAATTGASVTSFDSATTAANAWLWIETASKSGTTDKFTVVIVGHY